LQIGVAGIADEIKNIWGTKCGGTRREYLGAIFRSQKLQWPRRSPSRGQALARPSSMIRKSGSRFSEKIMLKQRDEIMMRFHLIAS
jgi:hypothetical protein